MQLLPLGIRATHCATLTLSQHAVLSAARRGGVHLQQLGVQALAFRAQRGQQAVHLLQLGIRVQQTVYQRAALRCQQPEGDGQQP